MSCVYRYHGPADHDGPGLPIRLRKRRARPITPLHPIGADERSVTDTQGTRPIESFSETGARLVTLTRRESDLIALAAPGLSPPEALEDLYPWLPECLYLDNAPESFRIASALIRRYGAHFTPAAAFCDAKWNTICNSLRRVSPLDARFHSAWHLPIQQAYLLEERHADRSIVAIDFNAMYAGCMQYEFPKPSALRHLVLGRDLTADEPLPCGLYRCELHGPASDFIRRHNPFRSFHSGRHLQTSLDEPIAIDLNEFELAYFLRHFQRIHLVDAVVSDERIAHPLAREARRAFARRQNFKRQGNKALADREKILTTFLTSCASRPSRPELVFASPEAGFAHLRVQYGIKIPTDEPRSATERWLDGRKGIRARFAPGRVAIQGPHLQDGSACHLLGQRIVARSRILLLEMMERILATASEARICYANIDSLHVSVSDRQRADLLRWLEMQASERMGAFKIEAHAPHGLWLEPGRYWLHGNGQVIRFRNRSIGAQRHPFSDHAVHLAMRRIGDLHVPVRMTLDMARTMSPCLSLAEAEACGLIRQEPITVGEAIGFGDVMDALEHNKLRAIPTRMAAFRAIGEHCGTSRNAASLREEGASLVLTAKRDP